MARKHVGATVSTTEAEQIIVAVRKGVPSDRGLELYSVGREDLLAHFDEKLRSVEEKGISDIKLASADWGHGKSHFLDLVRDLALKHNFVVAQEIIARC